MQPVQVPRNNVEPGAADGEEEGQATSQEKGANLGKSKCFGVGPCVHIRVWMNDRDLGFEYEVATNRADG